MTVMKASDLLKAADTHANRPAANAVPTGGLYSCTTHGLIYRSDGSSWATWATLGGTALTVQDENSNVSTAVTQIDFQGAGVTATSGSGEVVVTISGGSGAGGVLAYVAYSPGSLSSYTTSSTTIADVDATNLAVTFTAPSSGKVLVRLTALAGMASTAGDNTAWAIREASTTIKRQQVADGFNSNRMLSAVFVVTGLTSGNSYTYKWAWATSSGSNAARMYAGPVASNDVPATIEVHALP